MKSVRTPGVEKTLLGHFLVVAGLLLLHSQQIYFSAGIALLRGMEGPVYAPDVVAETILYCAAHAVRDVFAGGSGKLLSAANYYAPRLMDRIMEATMFDLQHSDQPEQDRSKAGLYGPTSELKERGGYRGHVSESSFYTRASLHPVLTGAVMAMVGLTMASFMRRGDRAHADGRLRSQTSSLF